MAEAATGRLEQQPGMSVWSRSVFAADRVIADPAHGPEQVALAIEAALTDYRRAFARALVLAGADRTLVWRVMGELTLDATLTRAQVAPIGPEIEA
jgi:hypothetical protein